MLSRIIVFVAVMLAGCSVKRGVGEGTWTGTLGGGATKPVGVRFVITDENGKLAGKTSFQDPVTQEFGQDGALTGTREGDSATWKTETDVVVKGTFDKNTFNGTLEFPSDEGRPVRALPLTLTK